MASKFKFQISRTLEEGIKRVVANVDEFEPEFAQLNDAFIIGFHHALVTNYVGLTTDYKQYHEGYQIVGLAFFKSQPSNDEIKKILEPVREFRDSPDGSGSCHPSYDQNEHLFLIYLVDDESKQASKKIFDLSSGAFLQSQPKLSVLDESKIYNHSAMVKLNLSIKLNICDESGKLASRDRIESTFDSVESSFVDGSKAITFNLKNSNFSCNFNSANEKATESLYDYLEAPNDIDEMGDYLPQMSKSEKEKLVNKWRNKMKTQRSPLEMKLEHEELGFDATSGFPAQSFGLHLELFSQLHMNNSISNSLKTVMFLIRHKLKSLRKVLISRAKTSLEPGELRICTFKSPRVSHLVHVLYPISNSETNFEYLSSIRRDLHLAHVIPLDQPQFRYSQRVMNVNMTNVDEQAGYLCAVHSSILENSGIKGGSKNVIDGAYTYHHYMQDRTNDNGWGCAYRSLQTIISWFKLQGYIYSPDVEMRAPKGAGREDKTNALRIKLHKEARVPTHEEIQSVLVDIGDKQPSFIGSQKWIGSQEVCYVLNHLYDIESKFISVSSGSELVYKARDLGVHFASQSTPIMIGGGVLAHTIIGVDFNEKNGDISYLILDPHYTGSEDLSVITKKGWCGWKKNAFWDKNAFYNLCLPQRPYEF